MLPEVCARPAASIPSASATSVNLPPSFWNRPFRVAVLIGDEDVEVTVAVDVEPHGPDGTARVVDADILADADEPRAVVPEQHVRRVAHRDKEVQVPVAVVVNE